MPFNLPIFLYSQYLIRARLLRENGRFLPKSSFYMRKNFLTAEGTGYLAQVRLLCLFFYQFVADQFLNYFCVSTFGDVFVFIPVNSEAALLNSKFKLTQW